MEETLIYNPYDWYYFATDTAPATNVWASARGAFVDPTTDPGYLAFVAAGGVAPTYPLATQIYDLIALIAANNPRPGKQSTTVSGTTNLTNPLASYIELDNTTGGNQIVRLPQANLPISFPLGAPLLIKNNSTLNRPISLQNSNGDAIRTIYRGDYVVVLTTSFATTHGSQTSYPTYGGAVAAAGAAYYTFDGTAASLTQLNLFSGQVVTGNTGNDPVAATISQDAALATTGALTLANVQRSATCTVNLATPGDYTCALIMPSGYTNWRAQTPFLSKASANISAATIGLFTQTGGSGFAIVTDATAVTITTSAVETNNNMQVFNVNNQNTQSHNVTSIFVRVTGTAAGTAVFTMAYQPLS